MSLRRLYVSAPFGNHWRHPLAVSVLGTYTLGRRAGAFRRWWRVLRTLRPYPGGWVNRLGLPNPGIDAAPPPGPGLAVSLHGFGHEDWTRLISAAARLGWHNVELNLSCPNVDAAGVDEATHAAEIALALGLNVTAKLGPVKPMDFAEPLWRSGVRSFHLCNTIPTPRGGVSGAALKPFSLWAVEEARKRFPAAHIVGGGGVYSAGDAKDYFAAGADAVAVGSALLNPLRAGRLLRELADFVSR